MSRKGLSHRTVVELLGDCSAIANALGISHRSTVAHWKHRGIPPVYWPAIEAMARRRGYVISAADLARTSPAPRARRARPQLAAGGVQPADAAVEEAEAA